jgi:hypothetical protein
MCELCRDYDDSWETIARWCLGRRDQLNNWEQEFIEGMVYWIEDDNDLTQKQARVLQTITVKLERIAAELERSRLPSAVSHRSSRAVN